MYKMVSSVGVISHINKEAQSFHKSTDESNDENEEEVKAPNDRNHEIFAPIPTSMNDLGLRFLTGRSAILTAINRPSVIKRFDHAVVKDIRECVFDMLCTKLPADSLLNFDRGTLPGHTGNATSLPKITFQKIVSGEWKKDRAEVVMQRFCLNTLYRSVLVENALNQKKWNEAESNMDKDDESAALFQSLRLRRSERQDLFDLPNVGAWRYDHGSLLSHPEVPMHLLLLGVSKNIMLGILQWAVSRRQGSSLRGDLSKMIDRLCKLSLNYVKPYRYGTG